MTIGLSRLEGRGRFAPRCVTRLLSSICHQKSRCLQKPQQKMVEAAGMEPALRPLPSVNVVLSLPEPVGWVVAVPVVRPDASRKVVRSDEPVV